MGSIKAIVFDMDGVLVDAKEWHYEALNLALDLFGYCISRFDHLRQFDGLPTRTKLRMLTEDQQFPQGLHDLVSRMKQLYTLEIAEEKCKSNREHIDALSRLSSDGYRLGVASNSIRKTVHTLMDLTKLSPFMSFMLSNQDVSKPKPHPEIYMRALQMAGVAPHECLVVEDNPHGIQAATLAGAYVLHVQDVNDVNYRRITEFIQVIESQTITRAA